MVLTLLGYDFWSMSQTFNLPGEQVVDPEILLVHTDQGQWEVQEACEACEVCGQCLMKSLLSLGETASQV